MTRLKIDALENIVEHVDGVYGTLYFIDCFEAVKYMNGMHFDLALSDIPWGNNFKTPKKAHMGHVAMCKPREQIEYNDAFNPEQNLKFLNLMKSLSDCQVLCTGEKNSFWWIRNSDPIGTIHIVLRNSYTASKISQGNYYCPYFVYGKLPHKLKRNVIDIDMSPKEMETLVFTITQEMGFLRKRTFDTPSAKDENLWSKIVLEMEAKSIFDCCAGSGTIGETGELLQIPWIGFEIDKNCKNSALRRIKNKASVKLW